MKPQEPVECVKSGNPLHNEKLGQRVGPGKEEGGCFLYMWSTQVQPLAPHMVTQDHQE